MKPEGNSLISVGVIVALTGFSFSGPLGFLIVQVSGPQPAWVSPEVFAQNYKVSQNIPYYAGFLLVAGMLLLSAGHYISLTGENAKDRLNVLLSVLWTCIFSALISFNYICQVSFIHHLALQYKPEYDDAISTYSMSNPISLCWATEMWGYGMLGVATWMLSAFYRSKNRVICLLLILNGILSVACIAVTIIDTGWLLKGAGLIAYFTWNALMIIVLILIYRYSKQRSVSK